MFVGEYKVTFLGRGRIALPKKIRSHLSGNRVVLSRGFENCIFGYEKKAWQKSSEREIEKPITERNGRALRRYLFSGAMVVKYDGQGRVVIPQFLLDFAGITDKEEEVSVIGAGDHFEIWNCDLWQKELKSIESDKF